MDGLLMIKAGDVLRQKIYMILFFQNVEGHQQHSGIEALDFSSPDVPNKHLNTNKLATRELQKLVE